MPAKRTIAVVGARGGQGTTTVAIMLALYAAGHHPTTLVAHCPEDATALLGLPTRGIDGLPFEVTPTMTLAAEVPVAGRGDSVVVLDAGPMSSPLEADERYLVVRGPCYLALHGLLRSSRQPVDGVIVLTEPGRSLRSADVVDVLGIPLVAEVPWSPSVARTLDAGLLLGRAHRLSEFRALHRLAMNAPNQHRLPSRPVPVTASICASPAACEAPKPGPGPTADPPRSAQPSTSASSSGPGTGTDLPCPQADTAGRPSAVELVPARRRRLPGFCCA